MEVTRLTLTQFLRYRLLLFCHFLLPSRRLLLPSRRLTGIDISDGATHALQGGFHLESTLHQVIITVQGVPTADFIEVAVDGEIQQILAQAA